MLGAIYIGLSGMEAYSKGLQTISNNVANLNTLGFKSTSTSFVDVFNNGGTGWSYTSGPGAQQSGAGVRFGAPQINFAQGDLRQSGGDLDLAIQGNGFLVLMDGDKTFYARTGQFVVDEDGYISLQGTQNHLAVLNASGQAIALNIDAKRTNPPKATTAVTFSGNLPAGIAGSPTGDTFSVSDVPVYDSRGRKQVWQISFTRTSTPDEWSVKVVDQTGRTVAGDDPLNPLTLQFDPGGTVRLDKTKLTIADTPPGADPLSVILDFSGQVTSQSSGTTSTLQTDSVDGNGAGNLTTVTVDDDGQIKLTYSNGKTELAGAVALADFRDPQQLERVGSGLFQSQGVGQHRLLASATEGMGKLVSKQVEASNVDLSQEFGDLILIQRGFQASSQVVSVSNDMIQQLFGIRGQG